MNQLQRTGIVSIHSNRRALHNFVLVNLMVESRKAAKNAKFVFPLCDFATLRELIFFQDQVDHYSFTQFSAYRRHR
ncbi:MAG TPA: hypothetical protein P5121_22780 [Caldilineaceae bacterium]|nr:hypothetical protein [Caldilineaceae bacterium]